MQSGMERVLWNPRVFYQIIIVHHFQNVFCFLIVLETYVNASYLIKISFDKTLLNQQLFKVTACWR